MFPLRFVDHMDSGTTLKNRDQIAEERQKGRQGIFQRNASKHKGQGHATKSAEFSEKFERGRGSFKIYIADFGPI